MGVIATRQRSMAARTIGNRVDVGLSSTQVQEDAELGKFGAESDNDPKEGCDLDALESDLTGEYGNLALLLVLYTLQGVPMGFSTVLPLILKERGATFSDLGTFSLSQYPFTMKLLWAPIVDTVYMRSVGRRKSWLVPAQLLIGFILLLLSGSWNGLLYGETLQINAFTAIFFTLYFMCATQDIAVDGWALTMLRKENVGYAATCNAVGQSLGSALSFSGCIVLEHFQIITLPTLMAFWGVLFIIVTLAVAIGKTEVASSPEDEPDDIQTAYQHMVAMARLRSVRSLVAILFTWKIGFATMDGAAALKVQEYGIPKEHMAYMTTAMMPVAVVVPGLVARYTSAAAPLDMALKAYPWKTLLVPVALMTVYATPSLSQGGVPWFFYTCVMLVMLAAAIAGQCMFVSSMAFFNKVSKCDVAMGGTYMTLLNTLSNLGGTWPGTVTMKLIDATSCMQEDCTLRRDGFYIMGFAGFLICIVWYKVWAEPTRTMQKWDDAKWRVK